MGVWTMVGVCTINAFKCRELMSASYCNACCVNNMNLHVYSMSTTCG